MPYIKLNLIEYELPFWEKNLQVAGVDEVGRGSLAGPIVAAGVVWSKDIMSFLQTSREKPNSDKFYMLEQINDSKKLSAKKRELLSEFIKSNALYYSIVELNSEEIDKHGVGESNKKALLSAFKKLVELTKVDHLLVDHFSVLGDLQKETPITKGDEKSISIASASIIAKVYRDNLMRTKYHKLYPQYGFDKHVGYGTKEHLEAIKKYGLCDIHRRSFKIKGTIL